MATDPTLPARTRGRTLLTFLLVAAGLALLVWQVNRLDLSAADVAEGFGAVGWWFGLILVLSLARFTLRSVAWVALIDRRLPLGSVLAASISGDALGNVTPLGLVASEPAKIIYLRRLIAPARSGAALTAENFFYSVSVAIFVMAATAAMLVLFDVPPVVRTTATISLGGMAVVLAGAAWLAWQRPSLATQVLGRLPIRRISTLVDQLRTFELATYGAVGRHGGKLAVVTACEGAFHLLSFIECWLIFWLLSGESSLLPALIFDGFNRVVNIVFKVIPMRLGVEESGTALLAGAIGLSAHHGFLLGLVRKVRMLITAAVGLLLWVSRARQSPAA